VTIVKIGLPTRALRQPLRRALATAADLGADGVEIDLRRELPLADLSQSAIRQLRKLLDDHNLRLCAVSYPTRRGYDDPNELDRRLAGTHQAMKVAAELGARVVVNRAYGELPEPETPRRDALLQALEALAREGNRVGARLAAVTTAEPASELASVLDRLPDGTVGVALHPANLLAGGQTPLDALEHLGSYVTYAYANDAVRDFGASRTVEVELGRGTADLPAVLAALDARNYTGWITVDRTDSPQPVTELGNAIAYLRSLAIG
jgi:sugar phosphate isomerase/epimerase